MLVRLGIGLDRQKILASKFSLPQAEIHCCHGRGKRGGLLAELGPPTSAIWTDPERFGSKAVLFQTCAKFFSLSSNIVGADSSHDLFLLRATSRLPTPSSSFLGPRDQFITMTSRDDIRIMGMPVSSRRSIPQFSQPFQSWREMRVSIGDDANF